MDTLKAVGLTPISVLSGRRTKPRKNSSLPTTSPLKIRTSVKFSTDPSHSSESLSGGFQGGFLLLSSVLNNGFARALTYEEALQQSVGTSTFQGTSEFDFSGFLDGVINFGVENPAIVAGGVALLAVPLVLSQLLSNTKPWGVESAKSAYAKLADDANARLLDIRAPAELRQVGSPDIRGLKKKPLSVVYKGEDKPGLLKKLALKFKEPENTTLYILDKFDGNSELVAELVTKNGFKAAYAIKDGAEGSRGWMNSSLPWVRPKKTLDINLSNLTDAISDALGVGSDAVPVALGIAAAAGLGLLAYSEVETILQLIGSAALVQIVSKKLLFAEDRKQTLQQVDELLNTKVVPKELVDDIKEIGKAFLPSPVSSKAFPAPAETSPVVANDEAPKVQAATEPSLEINSVPKTEILSPHPNYPDSRPPTSPVPSQP